MPDETPNVDETQGGVPVEDKAAVSKKKDSSFLEDEIKNLRSANDLLRTEKQKSLDALNADKAKALADLANEQAEAVKLKAEKETRSAEDQVELTETIAEMSEAAQNAVSALPESMTPREKLKYIKTNKELLIGGKPGAKVFSQPTGLGAAAVTDYKPASFDNLKGKSAILAEKKRLQETFGG